MKKIKGAFCKRTVASKGTFDRRSFRWKKSGKAYVLVGCKKGAWDVKRSRCKTGLHAYEVLVPASGSCAVGRKVRK